MLETLLRRRLLGLLTGLVVAGGVTVLATVAGVRFPYPVVLGVAVYAPIAAMAGADERFDREAYLEDRGPRGVARDAALVAAAGAIAGAVAGAIGRGQGVRGPLLVGIAVVGTFVGSQVVFYARTWEYHRPWRGSGLGEE